MPFARVFRAEDPSEAFRCSAALVDTAGHWLGDVKGQTNEVWLRVTSDRLLVSGWLEDNIRWPGFGIDVRRPDAERLDLDPLQPHKLRLRWRFLSTFVPSHVVQVIQPGGSPLRIVALLSDSTAPQFDAAASRFGWPVNLGTDAVVNPLIEPERYRSAVC